MAKSPQTGQIGAITAWSVALLCGLTGCATQGPLRAPSLKLPGAVKELTAARAGGGVDLHWTNPSKTSDGVSLLARHGAGDLRAEICRGESFPSPDTCTPIAQLPVESGQAADWHDPLPAALAQGPDRLLLYRVRVVNQAGRGAVYTEVQTLAGQAPAPLRNFTATPVAGGMALRWNPEDAGDTSTNLRVVRGDGPETKADGSPQGVLLAMQGLPAADPGGALDAGGRAGQRQRYTAYRTRTVQAGGASLVFRSDPVRAEVASSALPPPPAPPTGLDGVVNAGEKPAVDLVWEPSTDPAAVGYRVFRAGAAGEPPVAVSGTVRGFSFSDTGVLAGKSYRYTVVAVDAAGRSGAVSAAANITVPGT